jgi:hypothetical protein
MMGVRVQQHVLDKLSLPSRYEPLVAKIGPEVLRLLLPPAEGTVHVLEEAAEAVSSLNEGLFLPIHAVSGTGKTTLADNLSLFLPTRYTKTMTFDGDVTAVALTGALSNFVEGLPANEERVIPINIDHREGRPATPDEVTEIKRFLRQGAGQRSLVVWPETDEAKALEMSGAYRQVAGVVPLDIPIAVAGPPVESWAGLAAQTLQLANQVDSLEHLVDLDAYDVQSFRSLGDYLRQIALDFNARKLALTRATVKPVRLTILWATETSGHGILSSLTSSARFGMLDPSALLQACSESVIGQWWAGHRGLLVQTIVSLDAHVFSIPPPLLLAVVRRYGPEDAQAALKDLGFNTRTPAEVATYLKRSDLGRHLAGEVRSVGETRGNPAEDARQVFDAYSTYVGFQGGRDKKINRAFAEALEASLKYDGVPEPDVRCEQSLNFLPALIPDVSLLTEDGAECLEFTYRKGDFLASGNRSTIAQYCLVKLKGYATNMGWISADA